MKSIVTKEDVERNMQNVLCRTVVEFGKPTTYVTVQMENGFTVRESTTCVNPANYKEEIGKNICLEKIKNKIWLLLGYALQQSLYQKSLEEDDDDWFQTFVSKKGDGIGILVGERAYEVDDKGEITMTDKVADLQLIDKLHYNNVGDPITSGSQMELGKTYIGVPAPFDGEDCVPISFVIKPSMNGMFGKEMVVFDGNSDAETVYTTLSSAVDYMVENGFNFYELVVKDEKK